MVKCYGAFEAVKGISFEVGSGEALGPLGPNGAGKSTLIRIRMEDKNRGVHEGFLVTPITRLDLLLLPVQAFPAGCGSRRGSIR